MKHRQILILDDNISTKKTLKEHLFQILETKKFPDYYYIVPFIDSKYSLKNLNSESLVIMNKHLQGYELFELIDILNEKKKKRSKIIIYQDFEGEFKKTLKKNKIDYLFQESLSHENLEKVLEEILIK
ncbi:MAG: hypothetical protein KJ674_04360 [Nanoarchaeota archaeon]|nr:hypothetical protein [Nanoarchaeota archaeon]